MKRLLGLLIALMPLSGIMAQDRPAQDDANLTDMFLDYWPIILLPIFMLVVYKFWTRKK